MTRVFTEALESRLSELCVDSGQLAVAVLPATYFTPDEMAAVNGCCIVLDMDAGDSVACEKVESRISVTHGSDLCVPEGAEGWLLVLGDPCYFLTDDDSPDCDYSRACAATEQGDGFVNLDGGGRAFVSYTVYGDGSYPVRAGSASLSLALSNDDDEEDEDEDDGWGWDEDDLDTEEDE